MSISLSYRQADSGSHVIHAKNMIMLLDLEFFSHWNKPMNLLRFHQSLWLFIFPRLNATDVNTPEWKFSKMIHDAKIKFSDHSMDGQYSTRSFRYSKSISKSLSKSHSLNHYLESHLHKLYISFYAPTIFLYLMHTL